MKTFARLLAFLVLLALSSAAARADSRHHSHVHSRLHFGVVIGSPWSPWYPSPWYYPPPYYPPIIVEQQAPVYIERTAPPVVAPPQVREAQQYWYYCASAKAYYPYVKECPSGWQQVLPQPPAQ